MLDHIGITPPPQLLALLEYLTVLLFVSAGLPGLAKRYRLRRAAVAIYVITVVVAISFVALWWAGFDFLRYTEPR